MYIMPLNVRALNWRMTHMEWGKKTTHTSGGFVINFKFTTLLREYCKQRLSL